MYKTFKERNEATKKLEDKLKRDSEKVRLANERIRIKLRARKAQAVEYLGGKCKRCNQTFPNCVYDFHHRDPQYKDKTISQMLNGVWNDVIRELNKCDLLCSNCHRLTHYEQYNDSLD